MLGKIISGPYVGGGLCRDAEKGAMYIQTVEGNRIFLNRNTVENLANTPGPNGEKQIHITWKNGLTSVISLGAPAKPKAPAAPVVPKEEPKPVYAEPEEKEEAPEIQEEEIPEEEDFPEAEPVEELEEEIPVEPAQPVVPPVVPPVNRPVQPPVAPVVPPVQPQFQAPVQPQFAQPVKPAAPVVQQAGGTPFVYKLALKIFGIALGVGALIAAVYIFSMHNGGYENYLSYGGDAYTGIQNAAAQTANNVRSLADIVKTGFGSLFAIMGIGLIGGSLCINTKKPKA